MKMVINKTISKKDTISWRAAEYVHFKKETNWYLVVGIIAAILVIAALWQRNFFFAVFILLAGALIITLGKERPRIIEFQVSAEGVAIGKRIFYDYDDLEGFDTKENPERLDEIILKRKSTINPFVKIPVDSQLLPRVIEVLKKNIKRVEFDESLIDAVSDYLRF